MNERPRILMVGHTAALGGAELALLRMVHLVNGARFDCRVLLFSDGPLVARLQNAGVVVEVLPLSEKVVATSRHHAGSALLRFHEVWATASQVWRVARFIRANRIDLVHTHSLKANLIAGLASRLTRRPCIWHLHMGLTDDYMPPRLAKLFRFLTRTVPQYLIANSEFTLRTIHVSDRKSSWVIYPGIQLEEFTRPPQALPKNSKDVTVGIIGRISSTKGQDIFLRAAAQVLQQMPTVRFQVIGSAFFNDLAYEEEIHCLAESLGIAGAVEFTGFVRDVSARLHSLDVFVLASTMPEPFGQILVEAMAAGKPVIATDAGGVPEIINDSQIGLLVPPGDEDRLAEAICGMLSHPEQTAEMARRGRERAAERFTIERTVQDVEAVYTQILR